MAAVTGLVRATGSFVCNYDGHDMLVRVGEHIAADHPIAVAHPQMFAPAEPAADIEQKASPVKRQARKVTG